VCDWNEDSYLDIITGERNGYFRFFRRLSNGALTDEGNILANGVVIQADNNSWPYIHDYNEDGKKDLVVGQEGIGAPCNVYVYLNQGTNEAPVFSDSTAILFNGTPLTYYRTVPVLIDLDDDGLKDMVLGGWYSDVRFYTNQGTNANPVFTSYIYVVDPDSSTYLNGNPPRVNFTDWDGDGDQDMITCDYYGSVFLRENITQTSVKEQREQTGRDHGLSISPNPIVKRGVFSTYISANTHAQLLVYTIDGRQICIPFSGELSAGKVEIPWDISPYGIHELPNGAYIAVFRTDGVIQTQKLLIIR